MSGKGGGGGGGGGGGVGRGGIWMCHEIILSSLGGPLNFLFCSNRWAMK